MIRLAVEAEDSRPSTRPAPVPEPLVAWPVEGRRLDLRLRRLRLLSLRERRWRVLLPGATWDLALNVLRVEV